MSVPPIYIISLPGETTRRAYMANQMQRLGLGYTFTDAIDGRRLNAEEIAHAYDATRAKQTRYGELNRGEIGCALSHKKIWQQLVASQDLGWIVLEDDALLAEDAPAVLALLSTQVKAGEVAVFVQTNENSFAWKQKSLVPPYRLVYVNQAFVGAVGYYISKKAAENLLAHISYIYFPIDFWYQTPGFKGIVPVKAIVPPLVKNVPFDSTIGARGKMPATQTSDAQTVNKKPNTLYAYIQRLRRMLKNRYFCWPTKR